jgi:hypothetical protein
MAFFETIRPGSFSTQIKGEITNKAALFEFLIIKTALPSAPDQKGQSKMRRPWAS